MVRADQIRRHDPAVEGDQRVDDPGRAGGAGLPCRAIELVGDLRAEASGEGVGDVGLVVLQHVDAEDAVFEDRGGGRAVAVDADQERGPGRVGADRGHGRDGDADAPGRAVGGDHVHRRRGMAHAGQEAGAEVGIGGHRSGSGWAAMAAGGSGLPARGVRVKPWPRWRGPVLRARSTGSNRAAAGRRWPGRRSAAVRCSRGWRHRRPGPSARRWWRQAAPGPDR